MQRPMQNRLPANMPAMTTPPAWLGEAAPTVGVYTSICRLDTTTLVGGILWEQ